MLQCEESRVGASAIGQRCRAILRPMAERTRKTRPLAGQSGLVIGIVRPRTPYAPPALLPRTAVPVSVAVPAPGLAPCGPQGSGVGLRRARAVRGGGGCAARAK